MRSKGVYIEDVNYLVQNIHMLTHDYYFSETPTKTFLSQGVGVSESVFRNANTLVFYK